MKPIKPVRRVLFRGVRGTRGVMLAYRYVSMSVRWKMILKQGGYAAGAAPAAQSAAPPPPAPRPPVAKPAEVVAPERYVLPLFVTREEGSRRDWEEADRLVARLNRIFAQAHVAFEVIEPGECERIPPPQGPCPFTEELDHAGEFLHLALVRDLPRDEPQAASCGRCCLVSDHCDDRSVARAVGQLLGLTPVENASINDRLMSAGSDTLLSASERQWVRWHAGALLGHEPPLPLVTVGVWGYELESGRSEPEVKQILDKVNVVWAQAGIAFKLKNWCHPRSPEFTGEFAPLTRHSPRSLHLFFHAGPARVDPAQGLAVVPDELPGSRTWHVSRALGRLLGLAEVPGTDQLLGPDEGGYRLHPQEIAAARSAARALLDRPAAVPVVARSVTTTVPVLVHLAGSRLGAAEVDTLLAEVNAIWAVAGLQVKATGVKSAQIPLEDFKEARARELPGLDPNVLNLYLVRRAPPAPPYDVWRAAKVLVVSEQYPRQTAAKQVAMALATWWGVRWLQNGPPDRLMTFYKPGLALTEAEIAQARAGAGGTQAPTGLEPLTLPVRLHVAPECGLRAEHVLAILSDANAIWAAAGIRLDALSYGAVTVEVPPIEALRQQNTCPWLTGVEEYDESVLNLFWVPKMGNYFALAFKRDRCVVVTADYYNQPPAPNLARGLAMFLGLAVSVEFPLTQLTCFQGHAGTALSTEEIAQARAQAETVVAAMESQPSLEGLEELTFPVRLLAVGRTLEQARALVAPAREVWAQAGLRLAVDCCEATLEPGVVEAVVASDDFGPLQRHPAARATSFNVFLLDRAPKEKSNFCWERERGVMLMGPEAMLARALAFGLGLKGSPYSPASSLLAWGEGTRLDAPEIEAARAEVALRFPEVDLPWLRLELKLKLARSALTAEEALQWGREAEEVWRPARIRVEVTSCEPLDVPDSALQDVMGFGLMMLGGLELLAVKVFLVRDMPGKCFPASKILVVNEAGSLAVAIGELLGVSWGAEGLGPEAALQARGKLEGMFPRL